MRQVLEGARVASPDGSHRQRPSRAEDRLGGNRLPGQSCRRAGAQLSESSRFPGTGCDLQPRPRVLRRERGPDQRPRARELGDLRPDDAGDVLEPGDRSPGEPCWQRPA